MQLFYTDVFVLPLPAGHRFPMEKYSRLRESLLASGEFSPADFHLPHAATDKELSRAHDLNYIHAVSHGQLEKTAEKQIGFPWSTGMVERSRRSAGATIGACRAALEDGVAANLAGGTHHAFRDHGEGFCVFNDAAVDCDVHQGNGTASILRGDDSIFTFSIHGARNYPFDKEESDLDIELPDGCSDAAYLLQLAHGLDTAFDLARPDLVIYLAGADPYQDDRLGRLSLSFDGLAERDRHVFTRCREHGSPAAIAMAGGYARNIDDTVRIHATTIRLARCAWT